MKIIKALQFDGYILFTVETENDSLLFIQRDTYTRNVWENWKYLFIKVIPLKKKEYLKFSELCPLSHYDMNVTKIQWKMGVTVLAFAQN